MESMMSRRSFWERDVFRGIAIACVLFILLTVIAMLLFPGGSVSDPKAQHYAFFMNFFSDLGATHTISGASNLPSMILFIIAMTIVAITLIVFFVAFTRFFTTSTTTRWLGRFAVVFGIIASISFVGIAATPWNLYLAAHNTFVQWAFRAFLAAVVLCLIAILVTRGFPRRFAWVFLAFAVLLTVYIFLITFGPAPNTPAGSVIQATGQKIIVYGAILTVLVQSLNVRTLLQGRR